MILKTKEFSKACKTISSALSESDITNLEIEVRSDALFLNIANREVYVSVKYCIDSVENFRAVVNAKLFLELISNITAEEFELNVKTSTTENVMQINVGRSKYKLPLIYENDTLMKLPKISLINKTVEMPISIDILRSIVNTNGKEIAKCKNMKNINEVQKLYYVTEAGCFCFNTGACMNEFTLEKPIKLLLNDRVVKLFRLFDGDVNFSFGHDEMFNGELESKVVFETADVFVSAKISDDETLIDTIQRPYKITQGYMEENYSNKLVLPVKELINAISRLMLFTKNSDKNATMNRVLATVSLSTDSILIKDSMENIESVAIENGSYMGSDYTFMVNVADIKLALETCEEDHITLNCGNHRTLLLRRTGVVHLIPEVQAV